jgi:hypothetical protein
MRSLDCKLFLNVLIDFVKDVNLTNNFPKGSASKLNPVGSDGSLILRVKMISGSLIHATCPGKIYGMQNQ